MRITMALGALLLTLMTAAPSRADLADDIVKLVGENATNYIHPVTNSLGIGMNSGWYNSSKSFSFFKMPVGLQAYFGMPITVVNDDLRKYDFKGSIQLANLGLDPTLVSTISTLTGKSTFDLNVKDAPTIVGSKDGKNVTMFDLFASNLTNPADTTALRTAFSLAGANDTQVVFFLPPGLGEELAYLPSVPGIGINLGLPYKIQLGLRYMPPVAVPDFGEISQFGMKFQYEFTEWVPVIKDMPLLHTSAMYAFNNANLFDILKLNNWTAMVNMSADFKFLLGLGIYGGIGLEGSTMDLDYTVPVTVPGIGGTKVSLSDEGDNGFKALVGARVSLLFFDIMADATFANTNAYFVGVGIGLNGL